MKLPLHLKPDDNSPDANAQRVNLHIDMAQYNPGAWRTPSTKATKKKYNKRGKRMDKSRVERLSEGV